MPDAAVRTIREDEDIHVIEGLGYPFRGPFKGKDTLGTTFSARTDFHWDLFPDSMDEPRYIRPVTYQHGFDRTVGLSRVGGWSPVRADDLGVWVQAQLDKHNEYYGAIRELMDQDALGLSGGSAEHSVRINRKSGEIEEWPAYEMALTPTPSNPLAMIASRTAEIEAVLHIVNPQPEPEPEPEEAVRAGRKFSKASIAAIQQAIDVLNALVTIDETPPTDDGDEDASRSADPLPMTVTIMERESAEPVRVDVAGIAARAAREEAERLLRR